MQIRYAGGVHSHSQHGDMQLRHVGLTGALRAPEGNNNTGIMRTQQEKQVIFHQASSPGFENTGKCRKRRLGNAVTSWTN